MKQIHKLMLAFLLIATLLGVTACRQHSQPTGGEPSQSASSVSGQDVGKAPAQEPAGEEPPSSEFYPAGYMDEDGTMTQGRWDWNEDGTFTYQNENTLNTLTAENKRIETVTLPAEDLPGDRYALTWSGSRILAVGAGATPTSSFGVAYFTDDGGVHLANLSLFDRKGTLIRKYPQSQVASYDEAGTRHIDLPAPAGTEVVGYFSLSDGAFIHWLGEETAIFNCHSRIVFYDFAADTGRVLDDMSALVEEHGKFGVYYGADVTQCGVIDGSFYYLAHRDEEKSNTAGTVWKADENGAKEIFDGKEFYHLFVGKERLMAASGSAGDMSRIYSASGEDFTLKEVWSGDLYLPFVDGEKPLWCSIGEGDAFCACIYDPATGKVEEYSPDQAMQWGNILAAWVENGSTHFCYASFGEGAAAFAYDTGSGKRTELPEGFSGAFAGMSPDGSCFVAYDTAADTPQLRICPWTY